MYEELNEIYKRHHIKNKATKQSKNSSSKKRWLYILLTIGGGLFAACEGFDGITSMLNLLSLPAYLVVTAGILFAILAVFIFIAFEKKIIANQLQIEEERGNSSPEIDLDAAQKIKYLKKCNLSNREKSTINNAITKINNNKKKYDELLKSNKIRALQTIFSFLVGFLYFNLGFFTGEAVISSLATIFSFTMPAAALLCGSVFVGLLCLGTFLFVERPAVEAYITKLCGLDAEVIKDIKSAKQCKIFLEDDFKYSELFSKKETTHYPHSGQGLVRTLQKEQHVYIPNLSEVQPQEKDNHLEYPGAVSRV
jgi:hypothetical protein